MNGKKGQGGRELFRHEAGERLTKNQMCKAKCYDCCGGFVDGRIDCLIPECPLYPQMPYRDKVKYPDKKSKVMSESQKEKFVKRIKNVKLKAKST